ncbi:TRADD-N-associated membrane domain-containing protein [Iningainema tapete]|uniref:Cyanobacterial TRADD-N associated 2 transmembrane domain-containing protein n=1 Tax=Iningainema tapete BLCC-T55 TaxID=2748662 RepID=A0A8J7C8J9_9CYAN|nr:hypothetical protein [Iningainema tapete]MBD2774781.1 hypothetical protein [Iningainema tapete BLCC-T55]
MTNTALPSPSNFNHDPYLAVKLSIAQERLRQAGHSFNLSLIATAVSAVITLTGAGLLLSNQRSEGVVTAASGLTASVRFIQMAKDANNRLDKILAELNDEA